MVETKRKYARYALTAAIITVLLETFLFNYKYWAYNSSDEAYSPTFYLEDGTTLEMGKVYHITNGWSIVSNDFDLNVKNVHINVSEINGDWDDKSRKCVMHVSCGVIDEGHSKFFVSPELLISPLVERSMYIPVESFGSVHNIKLVFTNDISAATFGGIEVNAKYPFSFMPLRLLCAWSILFVMLLALLGGFEHTLVNPDKALTRYAILCLVTIITIGVTLYIHSQTTDEYGAGRGYADLAEALMHRSLSVADNKDAALAAMENPYDYSGRLAAGANFLWDTAYYSDKYYVYFGAIPAVVLYLPYYIFTGQYLGDMEASSVILVLLIIGCFVLTDVVRKKYCHNMPILLQALLSLAFTLSCGVVMLAKRAQIYYVAIGLALAFIIYGLALWLSSVENGKISVLKGMFGSLFMALAVGCRPQFALASFLWIAIFIDAIKNTKQSYKKMIPVILPYIPIAVCLMYYNYRRFGSVFDFGANYNLTGYDMVHMGIHLTRIPIGLWYYLFDLPSLNFEFPFLYPEDVITQYQGFMACEGMIGGILPLVPLVWLAILDFKKNDYRETRIIRMTSYVLVPIVLIADTVLCGILMRYQIDMRLFLLLPAIMLAAETLRGSEGDAITYNKRARIVSGLCILTILFCALTVFAQYEQPDYVAYSVNPVFFCKMNAFWGG